MTGPLARVGTPVGCASNRGMVMKVSKRRLLVGLTASAALVAAAAVPALARSANQMSDLVGGRASSGESQLEARGFTYITGSTSFDTKHSYWWNGGDKNCLHVETRDGRYAAIRDASKGDCNQKGGDNTGRRRVSRGGRCAWRAARAQIARP